METIFHLSSKDDLETTSKKLVSLIREGEYNILLLSGKMGSGKTTLIKSICLELEVFDNVTSPTFALINQYSTLSGEEIYHFDIYRINSIDEVIDIGYEEYFYSGGICFIEWHEKMEELIPKKSEPGLKIAEISITVDEKENRTIEFTPR